MGQEIFGKKPPVLAIDFVRGGRPMTEFVKVNPAAKGAAYTPQPGYVPTARVVVCTKCKTAGTLDFPQGFTEKVGDRIMDGKIIKAFCVTCRDVVEMRPLTEKEMKEEVFYIFKRYSELYETLAIEKKSAFVDPGEVIQAVLDNCLTPKELQAKTDELEAAQKPPIIVTP